MLIPVTSIVIHLVLLHILLVTHVAVLLITYVAVLLVTYVAVTFVFF